MGKSSRRYPPLTALLAGQEKVPVSTTAGFHAWGRDEEILLAGKHWSRLAREPARRKTMNEHDYIGLGIHKKSITFVIKT